MGKTTNFDLSSVADDLAKKLATENVQTSENTQKTKENTKAKKENTEKKKENSNATKQFNELLKQQQEALNNLNSSIKKQTQMIELQTDAFQKQFEVLKKLTEQKEKAIKVSEKSEGDVATGGRKGVSLDGSKVYDENLYTKSEEMTKSLVNDAGTVNTYLQNMIVKIREVNGEVKDVSVNFSKADEEIRKSKDTLNDLVNLLDKKGMSQDAIESKKTYQNLSKEIENYSRRIEAIKAELSKKDINLENFKALNNELEQNQKSLDKATAAAERYAIQISNSGTSMEKVVDKLSKEGINFENFSFKGEVDNVQKYTDSLGRVLTITKEITKTGKENFTYKLQNNFGSLSESAEKTYNKITRLSEGINTLRKTAETKKAEELKKDIDAVYQSMEKLDKQITIAASKQNKKLVNQLTEEYGKQKTKLDQLAQSYREVTAQIRNQGGWMLNLKDSWTKAMRSFTTYMSVTTVFYQGVRAIRSMVDEVKKLDESLTEFKKVSDLAGDSLDEYVKKAYEAGETVAKTGREMIESATSFKKSGYDEDMALQLGKVANMYTNIADEEISAGDAADFIIAQLKAFNLESENATKTLQNAYHVIDAVNEVANNFAVSSADIASNLGRASAVMANAGNSLEQMIGLMTAGTEITRNATKVANGLKTITLRLQGMNDEGEKDLELQAQMEGLFRKLGVSVYKTNGELKNTYEILETLAAIYPQLTNAEKAYVTETIAGKFQAQNAAAILNNWKTAVDATTTALNSNGSAMKENEKVLDSIKGHTQRLQAEWEKLSQSVVKSDLLKNIIDLGTTLLKVANNNFVQFAAKVAIVIGLLKLLSTATIVKTIGALISLATTEGVAATATYGLEMATAALNKTVVGKLIVGFLAYIKTLGTVAVTQGVVKASSLALKGALDLIAAHPIIFALTAIIGTAVLLKKHTDALRDSIEEINNQIAAMDDADSQLADIQKQFEDGNLSLKEQKNLFEQIKSIQKKLREEYDINLKTLDSQTGSIEDQVKAMRELLALKKKEKNLELLGKEEELGNGMSLGEFILTPSRWFDGFTKEGKKRIEEDTQKHRENLATYARNAYEEIDEAFTALEDALNNPDITEDEINNLWDATRKAIEKSDLSYEVQDALYGKAKDIVDDYKEALENTLQTNEVKRALEQEFSGMKNILIEGSDADFGDGIKFHMKSALEAGLDSDWFREQIRKIANEKGFADINIIDELGLKDDENWNFLNGLIQMSNNLNIPLETLLDILCRIYPQLASVNDLFAVTRDNFSDLVGDLKDIEDAYNAFNDALEEYNEKGYISVDTLDTLLNKYPDYIQYLVDENGNIKDNVDGFKTLAQAKLDDLQASEDARYYNELLSIAQKDESYWAQVAAGSIDQYNESQGGTKPNAEKLRAQIQANIQAFEAESAAALQAAYANAEATHARNNALIQRTRITLNDGGTKKTTTTNTKAKWEKELDSLNKKYKNSEITIEQYIKKLEKLRKKYKKNKKAVKELDETIRQAKLEKLEDDYKRGLISVEEYIKGLKKLQKQYKKNTKEWNNYADKIKKGLETLLKNKESDFKTAQQAAIDLLEDEIDEINKLKDETEEYYDNLIAEKEKANEETERELELARLQEALENAKNNKNKRVYVQGLGWQWVADEQAIADAQQALTDFENDQEIRDLEAARDEAVKVYEEQIKSLEEYRDQWQQIADEYEKEQNRIILAAQLGAYTEEDILNQRIDVLEDFRDRYIAVLRDIKAVDDATADDISNGKVDLETVDGYAEGGVVDYTGLAKLHGSANKPEVVLSNAQAANLYSMLKTPQFASAKLGGGSTQVYNFDNLVLPNVTNARQFLNELRTITNINKNL